MNTSLGQALNFKLGDKRRVTPRKVTTTEVSKSSNFLSLLVTNIEHDYAYALELKKAESPRARHHMRNKLRKAAKRAAEFLSLLDELGEGKGSLKKLNLLKLFLRFFTLSLKLYLPYFDLVRVIIKAFSYIDSVRTTESLDDDPNKVERSRTKFQTSTITKCRTNNF